MAGFDPLTRELPPAHRALVERLRAIGNADPAPLSQLRERVAGRPSTSKLSQLCSGTGAFPQEHEVTAFVQACAPEQGRDQRVREVVRLLRIAEAERALRAASPIPGLANAAYVTVVDQLRTQEDWLRLGVHRPITLLRSGVTVTDRVRNGALPTYVPRTLDLDPDPDTGLRACLAQAAAGEAPTVSWVVVRGESAAGKTRAAVEAIRAELAGWTLLIPHGPHRFGQLLDTGPRLAYHVVWLDEIDQFLMQNGGTEQLRRLLAVDVGPVVIVGTLRTDRETALRGTAAADLLARRAQRITLKRNPLGHQERAAELDRLRALAATDPWLADALDAIEQPGSARCGFTEWLAAGPQLLAVLDGARGSDDSTERVGAAIVDAAINCYRAGYTDPCPEPLLREAHQLYLDQPHDSAQHDVFADALDWAHRAVAGATGLLQHDRRLAGDRAFDYLLNYAAHQVGRPHDQIWEVLLRHATPTTVSTIARAAHTHDRGDVITTLLGRAADMIDSDGLFAINATDALMARAAGAVSGRRVIKGEELWASARLAKLLAARGDVETLTARADAGDPMAAHVLADLLVERGDVETLTARADTGDQSAAEKLADLLDERGEIETLTARADAGDLWAARRLPNWPVVGGNVAELTARADAGDWLATDVLATLLAGRGDIETLTARADEGDQRAAHVLATLLAERGDIETLTARADEGDQRAADVLATLLAGRGDIETLTARADEGDLQAAGRLNELLAAQDDVAALTARADAGDRESAYPPSAGHRLAELLAARGDIATLTARADAGDWPARGSLVAMLARQGDVAALTVRADAGDRQAAVDLAHLLARRGDVAALTDRADAGDQHAAWQLNRVRTARGQ